MSTAYGDLADFITLLSTREYLWFEDEEFGHLSVTPGSRHLLYARFLCSRDLVGWEKLGCLLWISLTFFYGPFFNLLNNFSHGVHQLPNYLSEYMVVAYQKMQNDERVLKIYISTISVYENRKINAKNRENAPREVKNWPTTSISGS